MNYFKNSDFLIIRALTHFISFSPLKILLVNLGSVLQAVSASIGLLLMIPLAQLAGVDFQGQGDSPWGFLTYISDFIDQLGFTQNLGQILLVYSILVTFVAVLSYIRTMIGINIQLGYTKQTRMEVYNAMLSARWEYLASSRSSEFSHRLGTQVQSMSAVANSSISLLHKFVFLGVYTAVMFALNWQFTLLTIACGVIIGIILLPIRWSVRNAGQLRLIGYQNIFRLLSEHIRTCVTEGAGTVGHVNMSVGGICSTHFTVPGNTFLGSYTGMVAMLSENINAAGPIAGPS